MNILDAARAYLAKLPPAISGTGGHNATYRAACCLVRFGLADGDAMILLRQWNGTHSRGGLLKPAADSAVSSN